MRRSFCLACAFLAAGAMGAGADNFQGSFDSPYTLPDSVVVTANRFGSSDTRSAWPTEVITVDPAAAPLSLASGLDGAAGLDVRTQGGFGALATVSNWGAFNRHLLLLYNGRPVKDYSLGGFNLAEFSPSELSRIEIVKGPQSAFYGSDAVGGVVNLIAPTALADRLEVHTTVGSFGARGVAARAARRLGALGIGAWTDYTAADNR
ncbi:MAG TPA: TonB-dependent receptor plug domain-containing protein, partial [candidate division Zixibacteria bacterium]|nr:TonB-dependent receptor plug domain-containing protein [candidate division Zixibacteria bacterium]